MKNTESLKDDDKKKNYTKRPSRLTKFIFKVPHWSTSLGIIIVFSILVGMAVFGRGFSTRQLLSGGLQGILLIGLPSFISGVITPSVVRLLGGKGLGFDRSTFLSAFCALFMGLLPVLAVFFRLRGYEITLNAFAFSLGIIFSIRFLILLSISIRNVLKSIFPAFIQSALGLAFLTLESLEPSYYIQVFIVSGIFGIASYLAIFYMDAPLRKSFGISGLDFIRAFINYADDGTQDFKYLFGEIGERVNVPIGVVVFENKNGIKAVIVSPSIHPGPLGEFGSGDLPRKLARGIEKEYGCTAFIAHGAATHDFNLVSSSEVGKILAFISEGIESTEMNGGSRSIREDRGNVKMIAQRFGKGLLLISTLSPNPTEDIALSIGYSSILNARLKGVEMVFVDAHNCLWEGQESISLGSKTSFDIIESAHQMTNKVLDEELEDIKLGISTQKLNLGWREGFGSLGIRMALIETSGQRTGYVFIDGNNLVKGLREELIDAIPFDEAEINTSDNHIVNIRGENPIGYEVKEELVRTIKELSDEAVKDLEPVSAGANVEMAEDVEVFGSSIAAQLASTINAMLAMSSGIILAFILLAFVFSFIAFWIT